MGERKFVLLEDSTQIPDYSLLGRVSVNLCFNPLTYVTLLAVEPLIRVLNKDASDFNTHEAYEVAHTALEILADFKKGKLSGTLISRSDPKYRMISLLDQKQKILSHRKNKRGTN